MRTKGTPKRPYRLTRYQLLARRRMRGIILLKRLLGVLMRLVPVLTLCLTVLFTGCSDEIINREAAERAVDEMSIAVQCQLITSSLADIAATTPGGATAQLRAEALATGTSKLLDCGVVQAQGSAVTISLGGLGCIINGQRLWGDVLIDVSDMPSQARVTLTEVTDSGLSITGQSTLTLGDGFRTITDQASVTLNSDGTSTYDFIDHRTEVVDASEVTVEAGTRCSVSASTTVGCVLSDTGQAICSEPDGDCQTVTSRGAILRRTWDVAVGGTQSTAPHVVGLDARTREVDLFYTLPSADSGADSADSPDVTIDTTVWKLVRTATGTSSEGRDDSPVYTYERGQSSASFTFHVYFP